MTPEQLKNLTPEQLQVLISASSTQPRGELAARGTLNGNLGGDNRPAWVKAVETAQPLNQGGNYFTAGNYRLAVKEIKEIQRYEGGTGIAAEFEVVESDNPDCPVGSVRSWFRDPTAPGYKGKAAAAEVQKFFGVLAEAVAGASFDPRAFTGEEIGKTIQHGLAGGFRGTEIGLNAWNKQTRDGGTFTVCNWGL